MIRFLVASCASLFASAADPIDHCTGFVAGAKATADGAPYVGQTNDAEGGPGTSLVFVPAADHADGSMRPILEQDTGKYLGQIPQVSHTYAYSYLSYGVMNEHKLSFGETTCSGRFWAKSIGKDGTALFSNEELSKIALERCKTARCAIQTMSDLAVNHGGFYGEDVTVDAGSETLLIADTEEAWVFHILADPSGKSAIWGAQRVPEDKVALVPNTFVIRAMNLTDTDNFLLSENAKDIAKQYGFWNGVSEFDFSGAFSLGEYANPHYAARRMWRGYNLLAPSVKLDANKVITDKDGAYPFAVKPDKPITIEDVMRVYRDYYDGTPYSLVKDEIAAGPFNSPMRIASGKAEGTHKTGAWERPISIYRGNYAVLSINHPQGHGVVWFAPHTPHASVFAPAFTSAATEIASSYAVDAKLSVDRNSLFWAASACSNWAYGTMFSHAIQDIRASVSKLEAPNFKLADQLRTASPESHNDLLKQAAQRGLSGMWDTFFELMGKYNDGYIVTHGNDGSVTSTAVGYPEWWLQAASFDKGVADTPDSAFKDLKDRMDTAEALMKKINDKRKPAAAISAESVVV